MQKATKILFLFLLCAAHATAQTPNVLLILVDDLGYHDLSCHGSKIYQTPNIDALAAQSVEFTQAYANYPRCVPSRYALMTSSYPIKNGKVPDDGFSIGNIPVKQNAVHYFNSAGYQTAFFGKWHLGEEENSPRGFGFQTSVAAGAAGSPRSFHYPFNVPKGNNKKVKKAPIPDLDEKSKEGDYLTDVLTDEVIDYTNTINEEKPFFTVLSYYSVHQPLEAKKADIERNQAEIDNFAFGENPEYISEGTGRTKMRQDNPEYAAMVENLDLQIGRLLTHLDNKNLTENTIIIFTSDHGGLSNDGTRKRHLATSNAPLRAGKGWMYEGGIRVPLFIKSPELSARRDDESIVMLMDLLPTLTDFTLDKNVKGADGKSFVPQLKSAKKQKARRVFWYADSARPKNTGEGKCAVMRDGDFKLLDFYEEGRIELYDLSEDAGEVVNLVEWEEKRGKKMMKKLNKYRKKQLKKG